MKWIISELNNKNNNGSLWPWVQISAFELAPSVVTCDKAIFFFVINHYRRYDYSQSVLKEKKVVAQNNY